MPGDRERCIEAGANEYMSKLVKLNKLVKTINKLTGQTKYSTLVGNKRDQFVVISIG